MSTIEEEIEESQLIHEPASASFVKRWILLDGGRVRLAAVASVGIFLALFALFRAGLFRPTDAAAVRTLVGALVGGTLPFITIVLAIIQLVLTQELDWPEGLRERYGGAEQFRQDVESLADEGISPASPAGFLQFLVELTADRAAALPDSLDGGSAEMEGTELERAVREYAESVRSESEHVAGALEGTDFGTFDALSAVLGHHHGEHRHVARKLRVEHADAFDDLAVLEELIELLKYLSVARQTFKTLYVQHELAALSRLLLYVGFPTLFGGGLLLLAYPLVVERVGDPAVLFVVAAAGIALVFLPFVVLLSYTLRIATIAARTGDFGPFVPRLEVER